MNENELNNLKKTINNCIKCDLCLHRNKTVIQDGNPKAKLMFIGEAPGEKEDLTGIPFVGRSGKLLDKLLIQAGINRQNDIYICNIIKCRPPKNRLPNLQEIELCKPYLIQQIEIVKPKLIVLLGVTAVSSILGLKKFKITELHGTLIKNNNYEFMPFFHPSYLLRNFTKTDNSPLSRALNSMINLKNKIQTF